MINVSNIKITYEAVLIRLGYSRSLTKIDPKTENLIKENLSAAQKIIKPRAAVAFDNITLTQDEALCENGFKIRSKDVAKLLKGCFKIYGVVVTIGPAAEKRRDDFIAQKETFQALIFDAAGSAAAEETITSANRQIKEYEEKNGNIVTKRYSPGYGDWTLENQKNFLTWLGADKIGITLTDAHLMKPEKSVSAVIGVSSCRP
jgi:hypothetical protein